MSTSTKVRIIRYVIGAVEVLGLCIIADRSIVLGAVAFGVALLAYGNGVLASIQVEAKERSKS